MKIERFLEENLIEYFRKDRQIFLQKSLRFPVKTIRFSLKNYIIFQKKLSTFLVIMRFFKENLPVFTRKFNSFYRKL